MPCPLIYRWPDSGFLSMKGGPTVIVSANGRERPPFPEILDKVRRDGRLDEVESRPADRRIGDHPSDHYSAFVLRNRSLSAFWSHASMPSRFLDSKISLCVCTRREAAIDLAEPMEE